MMVPNPITGFRLQARLNSWLFAEGYFLLHSKGDFRRGMSQLGYIYYYKYNLQLKPLIAQLEE